MSDHKPKSENGFGFSKRLDPGGFKTSRRPEINSGPHTFGLFHFGRLTGFFKSVKYIASIVQNVF